MEYMHERSESEVFITKELFADGKSCQKVIVTQGQSYSRLRRHPGLGLFGIILFANKNYDSSRIGVFYFSIKHRKRKLAAMGMGAIADRCLSPYHDDL